VGTIVTTVNVVEPLEMTTAPPTNTSLWETPVTPHAMSDWTATEATTSAWL
jgi:hypothetical protein